MEGLLKLALYIKSVSSDIQTRRSGFENEAQAEFFKPTSNHQ